MILITGATGNLGRSTIDFLLEKTSSSEISVLARSPQKSAFFKEKGVDVRIGDYDNYSSLLKSFKGVDKLFFISGSDVMNRDKQHKNVIDAAKEAGIKHVVYTSFQRKSEDGSSPVAVVANGHLLTEKLIKESGITYTILKNALYMEGITMFIGDRVFETGTIILPAGNGKTAYASRTDMAEASANILVENYHENKTYEFSGPISYSFLEIANILTEIAGKKISYIHAAQQEFREKLIKAGVPPHVVDIVAGFCEAIKVGEFDFPSTDLERILGRKPTNLHAYLEGFYTSNVGKLQQIKS